MTSQDHDGLRMRVEPGEYGVCRLDPKARLPRWVNRGGFSNITRTDDELSILCLQAQVPDDVKCERDWRLIKVLGTLDVSLIGVLASLAQPLANARIGLLTVSTYDTDYLMVRSAKLEAAIDALSKAGHRFESEAAATTEATTKRGGDKKANGETRRKKSKSRKKSSGEKKAPQENRPEQKKTPAPSRRRSRHRTSGRRSQAESSRQGGSLYIGEEWEHVETSDWSPSEDSPQPAQPVGGLLEEIASEGSGQKDAATDDTARTSSEDVTSEPEPATEPEAEAEAEAPAEKAIRKRSRRRRSSKQSPAAESEPPAESTEAAAGSQAEPSGGELAPLDSASHNAEAASLDSVANDDVVEEPSAGSTPEISAGAELPADERVVGDEGDNAEGLYTGAIPQNPVETTEDDFESLGLSSRMVETLNGIGFLHPTPIQAAVLPMALEGSDIIGLAETGSGKTGAFGLPLAERLHHGRGVRGLILCPTREIALQTKGFLDIFGRDHELETAVVIGGVKFDPQIRALRRHPDIVVATPGRLADHMRRGNVRLDKIEELVLDEADHMLDLGFLPQIQEIVSRVPRDRRTMMFSATMPPTIERLAQRFLNDPYIVDLRPVNRVASGIEHRLYLVEAGHERPCLIALLEEVDDTTLVFARRKLDTEFLARQLQLAGLPAERIHSDRSQAQRVAALRGFREGKKRILVATDVAARGIDVPHLGHVINFGMPDTVEDYVHRAGRTARGKAVGIVSSIGTWQDKPMVKEIERTLGQAIQRCEVDGVTAYRELKPRRGRRRRRLL